METETEEEKVYPKVLDKEMTYLEKIYYDKWGVTMREMMSVSGLLGSLSWLAQENFHLGRSKEAHVIMTMHADLKKRLEELGYFWGGSKMPTWVRKKDES